MLLRGQIKAGAGSMLAIGMSFGQYTCPDASTLETPTWIDAVSAVQGTNLVNQVFLSSGWR